MGFLSLCACMHAQAGARACCFVELCGDNMTVMLQRFVCEEIAVKAAGMWWKEKLPATSGDSFQLRDVASISLFFYVNTPQRKESFTIQDSRTLFVTCSCWMCSEMTKMARLAKTSLTVRKERAARTFWNNILTFCEGFQSSRSSWCGRVKLGQLD